MSRREVELKGGSEVLVTLKGKGATVDLEVPNVTIHVDLVGEHGTFMVRDWRDLAGSPCYNERCGPFWTRALTLLAAYAMMRRGCLAHLFIPLSSVNPALATEK